VQFCCWLSSSQVVSCVGVSERTERILWPLIAALLAAWVVAFPLTNTDIWWHLAGGRHIAEHGLPDSDPFSVSAHGVAWVNIHWLFQLTAYAVWSLGEELALVIAKMITCGVGAALLVVAAPRPARGATVLVLVVSLFAVRHLVMARPIVVTLVLLSLFFLVLESYRRRGGWRVLVVLPLLQIVWVNTQGLHALGLVLVASLLAGAAIQRGFDGSWPCPWRPLAATLAACVAASFASPYGARAALLPWKLFARIDPDLANIYALNVSEFVPPWQLERAAPGVTLHLSLFLLLVALALVLARRRVVWSHVVLLVAFTALALMANRNILLLYWLGAPVLAGAVSRGWGSSKVPRWVLGAAVASVAVAVAATREGRLSEPAPFRVPVVSAAKLAELDDGGAVFSSVRYGGYLAWHLHPKWSPYIDGRLVLRTREQFAEYLQILDDAPRFDAFRERHGLTAVVLPTAFPERYLSLAVYLVDHPDWRLIFTDGTEVVLVYEPGAMKLRPDWPAVWAGIGERYPASAWLTAQHNLARLLLALGEPGEVRVTLAHLSDPVSMTLVARSHYLEGDLDLAQLQAERQLEHDDDDTNSRTLLALIALDRGQAEVALSHLRHVLDIDPYNPQARELLRRIEAAP